MRILQNYVSCNYHEQNYMYLDNHAIGFKYPKKIQFLSIN